MKDLYDFQAYKAALAMAEKKEIDATTIKKHFVNWTNDNIYIFCDESILFKEGEAFPEYKIFTSEEEFRKETYQCLNKIYGEYGYLEHNGERIYLLNHAHISDDGKKYEIDGYDVWKNLYTIKWDVKEEILSGEIEPNDESEMCDWENNYTIKKMS